jgi:hypothetical protein
MLKQVISASSSFLAAQQRITNPMRAGISVDFVTNGILSLPAPVYITSATELEVTLQRHVHYFYM